MASHAELVDPQTEDEERPRSAHRRARVTRPRSRTPLIVGAALGTTALVLGVALLVRPASGGPDAPRTDVAAPAAVPRPAPVPDAAPPGAAAPDGPALDLAPPSATKPSTSPSLSTPGKSSTADKSSTSGKAGKPDGTATEKAAGKQVTIDLTGYSWWDNTPAGSAEVGNPILHKEAGGTGSYADPITVAVPKTRYRPGTRFYLPTVRRYVIIEDSGASSASSGSDTHLDMWVDGRGGSESAVSACMDRITGKVPAEVNPPPGRPVMSGPIYSGGSCRIPSS